MKLTIPFFPTSQDKKSTRLFFNCVFTGLFALVCMSGAKSQTVIRNVNMGKLTDYLLVFTDGSVDANWQSASKGFAGNVAINGLVAHERTSGQFGFAGTIYTNENSLNAWENIVNNNSGQAHKKTGETARLAGLKTDLLTAFSQINALTVTAGYSGRSSSSLDNLNTKNGITETFVINITSGFQVNSQIDITGDADDVFFLRWDSDQDFANGYNGQVKFQSGGGIIPRGDLTPTNFINVAGDIGSSGGGSNPAAPYPQGPRCNNGTGQLINNGSDFHGGGFFTGYWLTTGNPVSGQTSSLSNAIFVGGWYSTTTKFSMTSGTSGVHIAPCPSTSHPSWGRGPVNNEEASSPTINSVQAYPNPAINDIYLTIPIQWQNKALVVEIFNPAGQIVLKTGISNGSQIENIRTATLRPGYYIMKTSCEGQTAIQKIIKQ